MYFLVLWISWRKNVSWIHSVCNSCVKTIYIKGCYSQTFVIIESMHHLILMREAPGSRWELTQTLTQPENSVLNGITRLSSRLREPMQKRRPKLYKSQRWGVMSGYRSSFKEGSNWAGEEQVELGGSLPHSKDLVSSFMSLYHCELVIF